MSCPIKIWMSWYRQILHHNLRMLSIFPSILCAWKQTLPFLQGGKYLLLPLKESWNEEV